MKSKTKGILAAVIIVAAIIIMFVVEQLTKMTYNSDLITPGNTAANLSNAGLFCESEDRIFFSNYLDDGTLYSMDKNLGDFKKLYNDKARYINADEHYTYYARINNMKQESVGGLFIFRNTGIYRIDHSGSNIKMLYGDPGGQLSVYRNTVYYQKYNERNGLNLYKVGIDGKNDERITDAFIPTAAIHGDYLYYVSENDSLLYRMSLSSYSSSRVTDRKAYMPVPTDNYLFYIDISDNYSIYRTDLAGSEKEKLVDGICSTYNVSEDGRYLYYQKDGGKGNGVYELDLTTGESIQLESGDFKWINIAGGYVFFYSFDEDLVYVYSKGSGVKLFTPEKK